MDRSSVSVIRDRDVCAAAVYIGLHGMLRRAVLTVGYSCRVAIRQHAVLLRLLQRYNWTTRGCRR